MKMRARHQEQCSAGTECSFFEAIRQVSDMHHLDAAGITVNGPYERAHWSANNNCRYDPNEVTLWFAVANNSSQLRLR